MDNLTACAIAASRAGMSYGQYMATRTGAPIIPKRVAPPVPVEEMHYCKECGKPFEYGGKHRNYCSVECVAANNVRRNREHARRKANISEDDVLTCPTCRKRFTRGDRHGRIKYCSDDCKNEMARKRDRSRSTKSRNGIVALPENNGVRNCQFCGKEFDLRNRHFSEKYCSDYCRRAIRAKRERERRKEMQK